MLHSDVNGVVLPMTNHVLYALLLNKHEPPKRSDTQSTFSSQPTLYSPSLYPKHHSQSVRLLTTYVAKDGAKDVRLLLHTPYNEHWPALLGRLQRKFNDESIRALKYLDADGNCSIIADSEDLMVAIDSITGARGELLCWTLRHGESI
jgi:hypothetical protein